MQSEGLHSPDFIEHVFLCGADGLLQHKNQLHYHFQKYPWDLEHSDRNPGEGEHSRRIKKRLLQGIPHSAASLSSADFLPPCHTQTVSLKGTYHLGISPHMSSYYHFICDLLPHLLSHAKLPVLISENFPAPFAQFLEHHGLELKRLSSSLHYQVEGLWLPQMPTPDWNLKKVQLLQDFFFAQILPSSSQPPSKRIYISRKLTERRHLNNEEELQKVLKKFGFQRFFLEKLPILQQVSLFQEASHVIAPHGAGLLNVLFSPLQTRILEIRPILSSGQFCFDHLFALGWKHHEVCVPPFHGIFEIAPQMLEQILERWEQEETA